MRVRVTTGRTKYGERRERRLNIAEPNPPIGRGSTSRVGIDFQSRGGWSYNRLDARSPRSTPVNSYPSGILAKGSTLSCIDGPTHLYAIPPRTRRQCYTPFRTLHRRSRLPVARREERRREEWQTSTKRRHNSIDQGSMRASGRNLFVRSVGPERMKERE